MYPNARPDKVFLNNISYYGKIFVYAPSIDMGDTPKDSVEWFNIAYARAADLLIKSGEYTKSRYAKTIGEDGVSVEEKFTIALHNTACIYGSTLIDRRIIYRKWRYEVITT